MIYVVRVPLETSGNLKNRVISRKKIEITSRNFRNTPQKPLFSVTLVFCFSVLQMRGVLGIQTEQHASHAFSDQPPPRIFASIFAPPVCGAWPPSEPAKEEGSARQSRETVELLAEVLRRPHPAQDRWSVAGGRWLVVTVWDYDCQPPDGRGLLERLQGIR